MNWAQFKDPISHMCFAGAVVACSSLTQEVAEWQIRVLLMSYIFVTEFAGFSEKHLGKTPLFIVRKGSIVFQIQSFCSEV